MLYCFYTISIIRSSSWRFDLRLCCSDAGRGDPIRRAADEGQADFVAEGDRAGIAAVLTADAEGNVRFDGAGILDGYGDEFADACTVEYSEGIIFEDLFIQIGLHEFAFGIVSAEAQGRLSQVIGAKGEVIGVLR